MGLWPLSGRGINQSCVSSLCPHPLVLKKPNVQGRASCEPEFYIPRFLFPSTLLQRRAPHPEGRVSLPNSSFDNTFHFSFLMLFLLSLNSPRHREPLPSQGREGKTLLVVKSVMASRTTLVGWGRGGGAQVFTTSSQSSIDAM